MTEHRTLALLRHGKSAYPEGVVDHDRPLAPRGVREAALAGDWLRANVPAVELVLCSTATRARHTLALAAVQAPVKYVERLYGAGFTTVVDEISTVDDDIASLLIVGHEPTMSDVAIGLAGEGTDIHLAERISTKFPTSAIAVLAVSCRWQRLEPGLKAGKAALVDFHVPR